MAEIKKKEILLESGTNELEVMEFTIADRHFGINVSKVVEIMQYNKVTPMPNSNPFIEGIFKPRESIMTVVNLASFMGLPPSGNEERDILIITHFNRISTAFHVHSVEAIHRISWLDIEKPDAAIYGGEEGLATGIARFDGKLITIVDFEKILADISPQSSLQISDVERLGERSRVEKPILIAEDSPMLERLLLEALHKSGYINVVCCSNGMEAWEKLNEFKDSGIPLKEQVSCVITDIEMPQMDGHRLTKLIKDDSVLKVLPVLIFSSLINEDMRKKGIALGANAQLAKPDIAQLVKLIDELVN